MNILVTTILKLLPNVLPQLIPLADSLVAKRGPTEIADSRLYELERALSRLTERSQDLERRMNRVKIVSIMSMLLALVVLITVLAR